VLLLAPECPPGRELESCDCGLSAPQLSLVQDGAKTATLRWAAGRAEVRELSAAAAQSEMPLHFKTRARDARCTQLLSAIQADCAAGAKTQQTPTPILRLKAMSATGRKSKRAQSIAHSNQGTSNTTSAGDPGQQLESQVTEVCHGCWDGAEAM